MNIRSDKLLPLPPTEFLAGIGKNQLTEVIASAEIRQVRTGQILCKEGSPPAHLFLLRAGRAKFYRLTGDGDEVLLTQLTPGDAFGLGTLLARPVPYIGTAETTRDSELLVWKQARIRALARKYPRLAQNSLEVLLRYLAAHFARHVDLVTLGAAERLASVLVRQGQRTGKVTSTGVTIDATNDELAALANMSSFTVSRLLGMWSDKSVLTKSRGKIFIHSPEKLVSR